MSKANRQRRYRARRAAAKPYFYRLVVRNTLTAEEAFGPDSGIVLSLPTRVIRAVQVYRTTKESKFK